MKEAAWLAGRNVGVLLRFLEKKHPVSGRKLQLFALACSRRNWDILNNNYQSLVEVAERFADGVVGVSELTLAEKKCDGFQLTFPKRGGAAHSAVLFAGALRRADLSSLTQSVAVHAAVANAVDAKAPSERHGELAFQVALLRHIVGNPFRPLPAFTTSRVLVELATAVYEGNTTSIGPLHDALLDAGHDAFAEHFHDPAEHHPKGCWALDWILGKT